MSAFDTNQYETALVSVSSKVPWGQNGWRAVGYDSEKAIVVLMRQSHTVPCAFAACPNTVAGCPKDCPRPECRARHVVQVMRHSRWCCSEECMSHCAERYWWRSDAKSEQEAREQFGADWRPGMEAASAQ